MFDFFPSSFDMFCFLTSSPRCFSLFFVVSHHDPFHVTVVNHTCLVCVRVHASPYFLHVVSHMSRISPKYDLLWDKCALFFFFFPEMNGRAKPSPGMLKSLMSSSTHASFDSHSDSLYREVSQVSSFPLCLDARDPLSHSVALTDLLLAQVNVIRDGKLFSVESADIVRGDVIKVEGGDLVSQVSKAFFAPPRVCPFPLSSASLVSPLITVSLHHTVLLEQDFDTWGQ